MIQLPDTQLQVSLRALQEVVAPALKDAESHVVEQLHLVMATLGFARQRLPYMRGYYRFELQDYIDYGEQVAELIESGDPTLAGDLRETGKIGQGELDRPDAEIEDYTLVVRRLRELIASAVDHSAGQGHENKLQELVIEKLEKMLPRQRAWFLPFGLDPSPEELPALEKMLGN